MSQHTHFRVSYDGPALINHEMDVRDLAPALLAIGDLLDAAARVVNADRVKAQVNVRASFRTGSFGIDLALATDWITAVKDMLVSENSSAILNAAGLLSLLGMVSAPAGRGLIQIIKWLRGRRIERVEALPDDHVRLHVDQAHLDIERTLLDLLRDLRVRRALDQALTPLDRDGVEVFASGSDTDVAVTIERHERGWFSAPEQDDTLLLEDEQRKAFSIVSLAFRDDNKWRLSDGLATIHAKISDADFLARVDQNLETFAKGDLLICRVMSRQWQTRSGTRAEYEVLEVLEHRRCAQQIQLPFDDAQPGP